MVRAAVMAGGLGLVGAGSFVGVQALVPLARVVVPGGDIVAGDGPIQTVIAGPVSFVDVPSNASIPLASGVAGGGPTDVPEPTSFVLLALGGLAALVLRKRRSRIT